MGAAMIRGMMLGLLILAALTAGCFGTDATSSAQAEDRRVFKSSYASQTGTAEGQDSDFSADTPTAEDLARRENFRANTAQALADEQELTTQAGKCKAIKLAKDDAREDCAAQMARDGCASQHGRAKEGECSECDRWFAMPECPTWPPLRTADR